jgi:hypothetical protein
MVILRPTRKLRTHLPTTTVSEQGDTALGDWYVNRVVHDRQPLLLAVSSVSLISLLVPARVVRGFPGRLADLVEARLRRLDVEPEAIAAERAAMQPVVVAPTTDRSVLGILVDYAHMLTAMRVRGGWSPANLADAEDRLAQNPCFASRPMGGAVIPGYKTPDCCVQSGWRTVHESR